MGKINIAIDGFSSCGKSTLAKELAQQIGYIYIDSGAMYRAVTLFAMRHGLFTGMELHSDKLIAEIKNINVKWKSIADSKKQAVLNGENVEEEIRKMPVSQRVSQIAVVKEVRAHLVYLQQNMAIDKGIVMDGRDIGTVVLPNAELKIFMCASPQIRAQRRFKELKEKGEEVTLEQVMENLKYRDHLDQTRAESPLREAQDARILDNSDKTKSEQLQCVKYWVSTYK